MGKVVNLTVKEGDVVKTGQPLLEIDPRNLETAVQNREASLATARSQLEQTKAQIENTKVALKQAQDTLDAQEEREGGLMPRESSSARRTTSRCADRTCGWPSSRSTQEQRIKVEEANLESARYDLNKVRMVSPIDGMVTRRNIEEGETAVVGTMNNAGTVLLDDRRHVGDRDRDRGGRNRHSVRPRRPAGEGHDRRDPRQDVPGQRHRGRQQPDRDGPARRPAARRISRWSSRSTAQVPNVRPGFTCTAVDHDGDAPEGDRRADPGDDRARADRRREGRDRARRRRRRRAPAGARRRRPPAELKPGQSARSSKACSSRATAAPCSCRSRPASPARSIRGPRGAEGRRRGHHRSLRVGAEPREGDEVRSPDDPPARGQPPPRPPTNS